MKVEQGERRLWLIEKLLEESPRYKGIDIPEDAVGQKRLLRSLMNVRTPAPVSDAFLQIQDAYLQQAIAEKGITELHDLRPVEEGVYLWQGDITTLRCGAIVNAANAQMLGCFSPCHGCIDNAIHTYAGVQLRLECNRIMTAQGHDEPTGRAKITSAYNLPCGYVIHTVGPIVQGFLTDKDERLLKSCYEQCLAVAVENDVKSIAFCCISTGVFGFPQREAAQIAVDTAREHFARCGHDIDIIFNVFKDEDLRIYRGLLG